MLDKYKLNERQKRFAIEYLLDANAYQAAIRAGYSHNYALSQSYKLLENVGIRTYIDSELKKIEDAKIAKADEVLQVLTGILRGEADEEVVITLGCGEGCSKSSIVKKKVGARDRINAGDLLGKRYGIWVNKIQVSEPPKIIDDIADDDYDEGCGDE